MSHKCKVLLVHSQLAQHGSERLMYEIYKLLNSAGHKVEVQTRPFAVRNQYYYRLFKKDGIKLHLTLITFRHLSYLFRYFKVSDRVYTGIIKKLLNWQFNLGGQRFYDRFDRIIFIGLETYCDSLGLIDKFDFRSPRLTVFHVMHKFQHERDYLLEYNQSELVCGDDKQVHEISEVRPEIVTHLFPLPFEMSGNYNFCFDVNAVHSPIKIVVVSSLSRHRPNKIILDYVAYVQKHCSAELHWFGSGDLGYHKELAKSAGINSEQVTFHGHVEEPEKAFADLNGTFFLQTAMIPSLNYAPLELMAKKMPVILLNINCEIMSYKSQLALVNTQEDLLQYCLAIAVGRFDFRDLLDRHYTYVLERHSSVTSYRRLALIMGLP